MADGRNILLFCGIIDILQSYELNKRLEHSFKSIITDGVCSDFLSLDGELYSFGLPLILLIINDQRLSISSRKPSL